MTGFPMTESERRKAQLKYFVVQAVAYLSAVLGALAIGCATIGYCEAHRPEGFNSQVTYAVTGLCTMVCTQLFAIIKGIGNGAIGIENKKSLDHLHECVHEIEKKTEVAAVNSVKAAEHSEAVAKVAVETKKDILEAVTKDKTIVADVTVHSDAK